MLSVQAQVLNCCVEMLLSEGSEVGWKFQPKNGLSLIIFDEPSLPEEILQECLHHNS